jgi:hypothetical protein
MRVWRRQFTALFATTVVNWDHQGDDFIVAFDKKSGANSGGETR